MIFKSTLAVCLSVSCFFLTNRVQGQDINQKVPLTLEEVWSKIQESNTEVKIRNKQIEKQNEQLKTAKAERLPEVDVMGEYARVSNMPLYENGIFKPPQQISVLHNYYKVGASVYFNIYEGKKTSIEIAKSLVNLKISNIERQMTISEIKLAAAGSYLDMLRNTIFKGFLVKDIEAQKKQLDQIIILQRNGVVLKSDVLRAELKLSKQTLALDQINNDFDIANQKLNILMGVENSTKLNLIQTIDRDSIILLQYEEYLNEAFKNAYSKRISDENEQISKLELQSVKGDSAPKIGLFADYAYNYPQIFLYPYSGSIYGFGMAGIKISYSVSSIYKNRHKKNDAKLEIDKKQLETIRDLEGIRNAVYQSYLRLKEAETRVSVAEISLKQSLENQRIISNTYFNHLSLITELLDADTQVLQSRFDLESAKIATQFQYFQLLHTIGTL